MKILRNLPKTDSEQGTIDEYSEVTYSKRTPSIIFNIINSCKEMLQSKEGK